MVVVGFFADFFMQLFLLSLIFWQEVSKINNSSLHVHNGKVGLAGLLAAQRGNPPDRSRCKNTSDKRWVNCVNWVTPLLLSITNRYINIGECIYADD